MNPWKHSNPYIGSFYSSNFIRFGQMYKVMLQASPEYRMNPEDLYKFYAKNRTEIWYPTLTL